MIDLHQGNIICGFIDLDIGNCLAAEVGRLGVIGDILIDNVRQEVIAGFCLKIRETEGAVSVQGRCVSTCPFGIAVELHGYWSTRGNGAAGRSVRDFAGNDPVAGRLSSSATRPKGAQRQYHRPT